MEKFARSTVNIFVDGELQATGVVVGKNRVVTCLHVINQRFQHTNYDTFDEEEKPEQHCIEVAYQGKRYPATLLRGNQHHDLCLLSTKGLNAPAVKIAPEAHRLQVGDKVTSYGLPKGEVMTGTGEIFEVDRLNSGEPPLVRSRAPSMGGCSGGGVYNDKGELIGVIFCDRTALPAEWVNELLARNDETIISRKNTPESEVDYYFAAVSQMRALTSAPDTSAYITWLLNRPESQFAANYFAGKYYAGLPPGEEYRVFYDDIYKALTSHTKPTDAEQAEWLRKVGNIFGDEPQGPVLLKQALELTSDPCLTERIRSELANHYFFSENNQDLAEPYLKAMMKAGHAGFLPVDSYQNALCKLAELYEGKNNGVGLRKVFRALCKSVASEYEHPVENFHWIMDDTKRHLADHTNDELVSSLTTGLSGEQLLRQCRIVIAMNQR